MNNKLLLCLCFPMVLLLGCSNIGNAEPQSLEQGAPVSLLCSKSYQKMAELNPDKKHAYHLSGMRITQKIKNGYLMTPNECGNDICYPALLYTNEELLQGQILGIYPQDKLQCVYYVGDIEYTTISGFNKRIHAYKLYTGKITSGAESTLNEKPTIIPNDLTQTDSNTAPHRFKDSLKSDLWDK